MFQDYCLTLLIHFYFLLRIAPNSRFRQLAHGRCDRSTVDAFPSQVSNPSYIQESVLCCIFILFFFLDYEFTYDSLSLTAAVAQWVRPLP